MDAPERAPTRDWRLPAQSRPPLLGELVERIDEALATARASESAVMTVGAAALDAAEQARRAAHLAERASAAVLEGQQGPSRWPFPPTGAASGKGPEDARLSDFSARADRVVERLRALERMPIIASH